ncbi:hypothetical protein [Vibrio sinus]|nr:hypothetical protein [Vibrio sinus]
MKNYAEELENMHGDHEHFYELWDSTFVLDKDDPDLPAVFEEPHE